MHPFSRALRQLHSLVRWIICVFCDWLVWIICFSLYDTRLKTALYIAKKKKKERKKGIKEMARPLVVSAMLLSSGTRTTLSTWHSNLTPNGDNNSYPPSGHYNIIIVCMFVFFLFASCHSYFTRRRLYVAQVVESF